MSIKGVFQRSLSVFQSKWLVTLIGFVALSLLIWFGGPLLAIAGHEPLASPVARLVMLLIFAITWGAINVGHQARHRRHNDEAIKSLLDGDDESGEDVSDEEVATLKTRITQALEILKSARLNKGQSVYQLPWYVLIGPPGTGKTTALVNSGLEFPLKDKLGADALSGIGGTRHCDWWFTNQAVLIDTAGRYTTQDSHAKRDARAWLGFLGLLKKYRPRRPINGAIITVSLADLLTQTKTERNLHARAIKHRVQELQNQFGMRFPVYVILTKADLVAGFSEFFSDFDKEQREQVWGMTFPLDVEDSERGVVGEFNKEFHGLLSSLRQSMNQKLLQEHDTDRRTLIYEFPKQLRMLQAHADDFLKEIFAPNAFEEAPMLRGVYIVSATQEGKPIDRVMTYTSGGLGLGQIPLRHSAGDTKGFFLKRLLEDIIFPEQNVASTNLHHEKQHRWLTRGALAASMLLTLTFSLLWYGSYSWNHSLIDQSDAAVQRYREIVGGELTKDADVVTLGHALSALRELPAGTDGTVINEDGIKGLGLYQGEKIGQPAKSAYTRALQGYLAPFMAKTLEQEMRANEDFLEFLYESLKTYLMLFDESKRDETQIISWFEVYFERKLPGEINKDLRVALIGHIRQLNLLGVDPSFKDEQATANARAVLTQMPLSERAYQRLRTEFLSSHVPDFRLTEVLGTDSLRVFQRRSGKPLNQGVPGLYTYQGFHTLFQLENGRVVKRLMEDSWVYGDELGELGGRAKDRLAAEVSLKYYRDYIHFWDDLLGDVELKPFTDSEQGAYQAKVLAGPEQPLQNIIEAVREQVALTKLPISDEAAAAGEVAASVADVALARQKSRISRYLPNSMPDIEVQLPGAEVEAHFEGVIEITDAELDKLHQSLKSLHRYLDQLSAPGDNDKAAYISQLGGNGQGKLSRAMYQVKRSLPSPFDQWINGLANQTSSLAQQGARTHLNDIWRDKVLAEYRSAIKGRYPVTPSSTKEVTLKDFGGFFGYGGTLDSFFTTYLEPFVDTSKTNWRFEKNIGVSASTLKVFERARRIRDAFFADGSQIPHVEFGLKPAYLDRSISHFMLELDGQTLSYRHGPLRLSNFEWPGRQAERTTRVMFAPPRVGRSITATYDGDWGWFRLLDKAAESRPETVKDKLVQISLQGNKFDVELIPSSVNHPFWNADLERFKCPIQL
ncbi:type VI secretion system membrane subunit TssM [Corallincola luteus]|uniref:Type VI secretion system membrane subunit TssM n=1 Tax=Corallincola luteus TaxID=1775177 RepID=A0ABY2AL42_9GAMM|nr:type VI secretion system membrane subunit TssM [Corallincola luteus]TCI03238.1 type VI secretion system membrane subunit TssM [Corallincola luteus]